MLNRLSSAVPEEDKTTFKQSSEAGLDLSSLAGFARRQWPTIAVALLVGIGLAFSYLLITPPRYLAKSSLLLDTRRIQLFQQQSVLSDTNFDVPAVESQIEILRSESIALSVVQELKLANDPEFTGQATSFFGTLTTAIWKLFTPASTPLEPREIASQEKLIRTAVGYLRGNLQVQRVRLTYVIEIGFQSLDPGKAAHIANAVAEAYILDQTQSKQYTTQRAADWLQGRMMELRQHALEEDRAVQDYKTQNNIIQSGGRSLDEQQLAELSTQLVQARAQTADAKARLERVRETIASGVPDAAMTASLQNDVINRIRQQYVDISRREADYAARFGRQHQAVVNLRKEMQQLQQSATDELRRIEEGIKNDLQISQTREQAAENRLKQLTEQDAETRQTLGTLRVLESSAQAYRTLHDSFLQRYIETTQQQTVTSTEARVITGAVGATKVHPNTSQVLSLGTVLALMLGCGAAYARERLDHVFRTPKQVEKALGVECLGVLPAIEGKPAPKRNQPVDQAALSSRTIAQDLGIGRQVVLTPFARFTETVRSIKVAADTCAGAHGTRVIGIVSAVPGEGKTTIAANLAQLLANGGHRTLLIDADLRNPSLTKMMAPHAQAGLVEVLLGRASVESVTWRDPITALDFLPAVLPHQISHSSEVLTSPRMKQLIAKAREEYAYTILDFPPLAPVIDAKAAAHLVEGFIFIIEWGRTSQEVIVEALGSAELVQSKLVGAVLNRANPSALRRLEAYKGYNYHRYYSSYQSNAPQ
jgi:succinoglycan biosynthesis transport protein ExoP